MSHLDTLFSRESIQNFQLFEKACEEKVLESGDICHKHLYGEEDVKFFDTLFERNRRNMEKFIEESHNKKPKFKITRGGLSGDRGDKVLKQLVDANRGDKLNTPFFLYESFKEQCGKMADERKTHITRFIMEYIKDHIQDLSSRGPGKHVIFHITNENEYFAACNIDKKVITEITKGSEYIDPKWFIANKALNMLMTLKIFYYWNNMSVKEKKSNDYKQTMVFLVNLIFTIRFYSSINMTYFPYEVDEELMYRTIELLSDRYKIKSFNTIYELLEYIAYTNITNTIELMEKPNDFNVKYFMDNLNSRINTTINGIASQYYEMVEKGGKVTTDALHGTNEEGDTYLNMPETVSTDIEGITRKMAIKVSTDSTVSDRLLIIACKETKLSIAKMKATMMNMVVNDKDLIIELIRRILIHYLGYLKKDKSTIKSINFITLMKKTYNISNTKEPGILLIKETLHALMTNNSKEYLKTSRVATLSNMRACLFYYWLLYINDKIE